VGALSPDVDGSRATVGTRLNKDSHKPPSSGGLAKLPRRCSRRKQSGKASGGQPSHPGTTLMQVAQPDEVVAHSAAACGQRRASLETAGVVARECRQVFELPPGGWRGRRNAIGRCPTLKELSC
jgi:hypothetical protein